MNETEEKVLKATHGSPDHPLKIGEVEIPCYVLEDGRRVLHQTGMVSALGMSRGGSNKRGGDRLAKFVAGKALQAFITSELAEVTQNPIKFRTPSGNLAYGYEATILADICEAVLAARKVGVLQKQQAHIADKCEILMRGFARVGIVALVDEVTGYQDIRVRDALHKILEKYVSEEAKPWVLTFDDEFYKLIFRLNRWPYDPDSVKRPSVIGHWTNDIYDRLAPGVRMELHRVVRRNQKGRPTEKLHQHIKMEAHPELEKYLEAIKALMRASSGWKKFERLLQRAYPKVNTNLEFPFDED